MTWFTKTPLSQTWSPAAAHQLERLPSPAVCGLHRVLVGNLQCIYTGVRLFQRRRWNRQRGSALAAASTALHCSWSRMCEWNGGFRSDALGYLQWLICTGANRHFNNLTWMEISHLLSLSLINQNLDNWDKTLRLLAEHLFFNGVPRRQTTTSLQLLMSLNPDLPQLSSLPVCGVLH